MQSLPTTILNLLRYDSKVAIKNLGSMFYYIVGVVVFIVLILMIRFLRGKYQM